MFIRCGDDTVHGGPGNNTVGYGGGPGVTANLLTRTVTGVQGNDTLVGISNVAGSSDDDVIVGNGEDDGLYGDKGDD